MNAKQWRLSRQVLGILGGEPGMSEAGLAERLGVSARDVRPVTGMLLGRGQVERCDDYLVLSREADTAEGRNERPGSGDHRELDREQSH